MGCEIERKFLVTDDSWRPASPGMPLRQGYLCTDPDRTVRVRLAGEQAWMTIKGRAQGFTRAEFEWPIPPKDAIELLDGLCLRPQIEKVRHRIEYEGRVWEVDEFSGENAGLVVAEVELPSEDAVVVSPPWVGQEVTDDPRYGNSSLVARPFSTWSDAAAPG